MSRSSSTQHKAMPKVLLITGATGKQGRATIDALLADTNADIEILALTRNSESPGAKKLAAKSPKIKLIQGHLDQPLAIFESAKKIASGPIWGLFSYNAFDIPVEIPQATSLHSTAITHGIKYIVYSSVDRHGSQSPTNPTPVPHFKTKHAIEQHLFDLVEKASPEVQYCVLRPTTFMENYADLGKAFPTTWKVALGDIPMQLIAVTDIGVMASKALLDPEKFAGKCIGLAGDELTFAEAAKVYEEVAGKPWGTFFEFLSRGFLMVNTEMRLMFRWLKEQGYAADVEGVRSEYYPGLKTWRMFLEEEKKMGKKL